MSDTNVLTLQEQITELADRIKKLEEEISILKATSQKETPKIKATFIN